MNVTPPTTVTADQRLADRYGHPVDFTPPQWNDTLDLLLRHHSVRQWLPVDVDEATVKTIIAAAQSAPSSSNKQVVSVVVVRDDEAKRRLAAVGRQMSSHIVNAPVTLVWLIDFSQGRYLAAHAENGPADLGALDYVDEPMMAAGDVGIAAQTAAVAAASLGLGSVFLGSLRNDIAEVRDILGIPETVVPFLGLEIGVPDPEENAGVKPRLPMELFLHLDRYNSRQDATGQREHGKLLEDYDGALASYFARYGSHPRWSDQLLGRLAAAATEKTDRKLLRAILNRAGFGLR